jgi:two-component system, OmpR family, response regulator
MRLLVVEDEEDLAASLARSLREEGFAVDVATDGADALLHLAEPGYDAVILDLMLPKLDGASVLRHVRRGHSRVPVLVLTARDATADKVRVLDLGADDYLTKPFSFDELLARVRALIRRAAVHPSPAAVIGKIHLDTAARRVTRGGREIALTAKEYALLEYLALHRGTVVSRTTLYEHLYDHTEDTLSNVIDVYVANLRRKLGADVVRTRRGQGYLIESD